SHIWPCSRWGLPSQPVARLLVGSYIKGLAPPHHFTLTAPGVIPGAAVSFCCTFPVLRRPRNLSRARLERWALPTTASCGARTFLPLIAQATTVRPARERYQHTTRQRRGHPRFAKSSCVILLHHDAERRG